MREPITSFRGEYRFLSNFWPVDVPVVWWPTGKMFVTTTVEHAYQACKARDFEDFKRVLEAPSPQRAKSLGRHVRMRPEWDYLKLGIMTKFLHWKFSRPDLAAKLQATYPAQLIEGNWWGDRFWGVYKGVGENHLGKLLMSIRDAKIEECGMSSSLPSSS